MAGNDLKGCCAVGGGPPQVVQEAYPDHTAQDSSSKYYDPKASKEDPRWWMVDFQLVRRLQRQVGWRSGGPGRWHTSQDRAGFL